MKRVILAAALAALAFGAMGAHAGQGGNCSPEGTWYGGNWIVTITRSGPNSYTSVMDDDANFEPVVTDASDFRGEFVKTGPKTYDWTTMQLLRTVEGSGFPPLVLSFCPAKAKFTGCDSWEAEGACSFYGYSSEEEDPFEVGELLFESGMFQTLFKRMPMTFPTP